MGFAKVDRRVLVAGSLALMAGGLWVVASSATTGESEQAGGSVVAADTRAPEPPAVAYVAEPAAPPTPPETPPASDVPTAVVAAPTPGDLIDPPATPTISGSSASSRPASPQVSAPAATSTATPRAVPRSSAVDVIDRSRFVRLPSGRTFSDCSLTVADEPWPSSVHDYWVVGTAEWVIETHAGEAGITFNEDTNSFRVRNLPAGC